MKYYKFLDKDNTGPYSNFDFTPYLPKGDKPGKWLPAVDALEMCNSGYHVCDADHLPEWANANLYEVEVKGRKLEGDDKSAHRQIRFVRKIDTWNDKTARLFACWCARQVWDLLTDERSKEAVVVTERFANGDATEEELSAARAAAQDAAWAAQRKHLAEMLGID